MHQILKRMGRRGTVLALLGACWIARGLSILHDPGLNNPDDAILHNLLPAWLRVSLWTLTGLTAILTAWNVKRQDIGWAALIFLPLERVVSHLWSVAMWVVPGPPSGTWHSAIYIIYWVTLVCVIVLLASWREDEQGHLDLKSGLVNGDKDRDDSGSDFNGKG